MDVGQDRGDVAGRLPTGGLATARLSLTYQGMSAGRVSGSRPMSSWRPVRAAQWRVSSRSETLMAGPPPTLKVAPSRRSSRRPDAAAGRTGRPRAGCRAPACRGRRSRCRTRAAEQVPRHPQDDETLVDLAHLPGAGDHAAAVDHRAQAVHRAIFLDQQFGGELGGAVQGTGAGQRKIFGNAGGGPAWAVALRGDQAGGGDQAIGLRLQRQRAQSGDRIDAAAGQEHQVAAGAAQVLQAVDQAGQVGVQQVAGASAVAGMDAGFGRTFDQQIDRAGGVEVLRRSARRRAGR